MFLRHHQVIAVNVIALLVVALPIAILLIVQDQVNRAAITMLFALLCVGMGLISVLSTHRRVALAPLNGPKLLQDGKHDDIRKALFSAYLLAEDPQERALLMDTINELFEIRTRTGRHGGSDAQPATPPQQEP